MERIVDTNILMRYLLNDVPDQSKEAYNILKQGFKLYPEVLAECVYVLEGVYECSKDDIDYGLSEIIESADMEEKDIYREALYIYYKTSLDFVDSVLLARNQKYGDRIFTFDKKLKDKLN